MYDGGNNPPDNKVEPQYLRQQVQEATETMQSNLQQMAQREAQLNVIGEKSDILQGTSHQFYQYSRRAHFSETMKRYYLYAIVAVLVIEAGAFVFYRSHFLQITTCVVLSAVAARFALRKYEANLQSGTYQVHYDESDDLPSML
eukprot:GEMP01063648.1.p1 GENE.GEMP01063648.1~~GEMP01063648.1.p1  ORF type:complete len:144 (+),score=23.23 GEMP01063648.1:105-536(+)